MLLKILFCALCLTRGLEGHSLGNNTAENLVQNDIKQTSNLNENNDLETNLNAKLEKMQAQINQLQSGQDEILQTLKLLLEQVSLIIPEEKLKPPTTTEITENAVIIEDEEFEEIFNQTLQKNFDENLNCLKDCGAAEDTLPRDCFEAMLDNDKPDGIYILKPIIGKQPYGAFCKRHEGKGWTIIQRRRDGTVDFYKDWQAYKNGFGNLAGEYWLGLERLHALTSTADNKLWLEMKTYGGDRLTAQYGKFVIAAENEGYMLKVGHFIGNVSNALRNRNNQKFSTYDKDNTDDNSNCGYEQKAAFWYYSCGNSNLNGEYKQKSKLEGIWWHRADSEDISLKYTHMAISQI